MNNAEQRLTRWEWIVYAVILALAIFTRFYILGTRAISHDESIHTQFSWNLYAGQGFQHNPMMHGPLLFEATALSYLFFGANDFTSRIFTSLAGVALVMTPVLFRRWLGRTGAIVTSVLLLISPSISFYSRYIRHDVLLLLSAVLLLWLILRYLETGRGRFLYWLAATFSIMYATKEASYIYTAIFGALLFLPFAYQLMCAPWQRARLFRPFLAVMIVAVILGLIFTISFTAARVDEQSLDEGGNSRVANIALPVWGRVAAAAALGALLGALVLAYYGIGEATMREVLLFDVLMVIGTLTLPLGSAFLIKFVAGVDMGVVYEAVGSGNFGAVPPETVVAIFAVTLATLVLSVVMGMVWDPRRWPKIALIHYTIFIVLYTTIFTWGFGALSGLIGSLAYWLAQQGVKRGNQPGYYYLIIGPMYEYLPLLISTVAGASAIVGAIRHVATDRSGTREAPRRERAVPALNLMRLFPLFLLGWTILSWIAYTYAGEKMPWLLVHIALPSIFLAGWGLGRWLERLVRDLPLRSTWWPILGFAIALPLFVAALVVAVGSVRDLRSLLQLGITGAGWNLAQLHALGRALGGLLGIGVLGGLLVWTAKRLGIRSSLRLAGIVVVVFLIGATVRTTVMANYVNYDLPTEFLVYAHGTSDIKVALEMIRDVSWEVTGTSHDVKVAYGEQGSWPFTWYMEEFPNNYFYSTTPDAEQLLASPVVIAGSPQYAAVDEILGSEYIYFEYNYLWWPIQDYYDLTPARIRGALSDPQMLRALWRILWYRDYDLYAQLKNSEQPFTLRTWPYREEFRLYVRRELAQEIWPTTRPAGAARYVRPTTTVVPDPYAAGEVALPQVSRATLPGSVVRGMVRAADGTFYVADTATHRIWHITPDGEILDSFGGFGSAAGQFSEPWDVAIDAEGNIYVADTWNHRIQKFSSDHEFVTSWGGLIQAPQTGDPATQGFFYGPRALDVSPEGELYVADTGNKRIQVFDLDGTFLREFGGGGNRAGELNEPVGVDVNEVGLVAVADTWNARIQIFNAQGLAMRQWRIPTWQVTNPEEKPFLAWGDELLYVTAPLERRVLAFDAEGSFAWALSADTDLIFPQSVLAVDDILYVGDGHSGQVIGYQLP